MHGILVLGDIGVHLKKIFNPISRIFHVLRTRHSFYRLSSPFRLLCMYSNVCIFYFNGISHSNFYTLVIPVNLSFYPQEEQQASNNGDAVTDAVEVQEESNEPLIPDVAHEEKSAAVSDVQEVVPQEQKSREVPTPDKKVGGRGGEDGFDDDPEILQGNVSDDEAITGGLEAPEVDSKYFNYFYLSLSFDVFLVLFIIGW